MRLSEKVALVTGAGSGIGRASAALFAREGARVGVLGHKPDELEDTVATIVDAGGDAAALVADVSDPIQMGDAVADLVGRWGRLDVVMANAGINGVWAPIDEIEPEEWDRTLNVNLKGTFLTMKYATPHLKVRGGSVIVTASVHGTRVFTPPGTTAYACSKVAQVALAKKLALELARYRVRVNAICPGSTETNVHDSTTRRNLEAIRLPIAYPEGTVPLTRGVYLAPEEVAKLALFLASDDAATITGTEVWVDGGMSLFMG